MQHACTRKHAYLSAHRHTHTHTHTNKHAYVHKHTRAHTHTQMHHSKQIVLNVLKCDFYFDKHFLKHAGANTPTAQLHTVRVVEINTKVQFLC